ncbi:helix-turn-helix domain-containing protein [Nocardiopsis changdeensis]|uniref:Helix-turn-helix domain-containing protein n=1 Tax=Nocardiopsis changdeensis TaxID=2831969 RepID=A0ABX8BSR0_9ACTN|nr:MULTISPECIES: helix-turn-helix domain-containing protein [Nocardiopsis]QUX25091.1 helix-turn-helix domain-containing protein [Nocardiopsis changdeensis]QYX35477.1 helix-turn-helix domain-containing protein [Nocardiopsis sp. MT53]
MATADVLLHPVRLRVVQSLFDSDPLTTAQLRDRLPDIPPATLYRHIAVLVEAGVLEVVEERRVRGAVERGYRLSRGRVEVDPEARAAMTADDHRRAFTAFAASLMADFDRYLDHEDADPVRDGVAYRQAAAWLTDEELADLVARIGELVLAAAGRGPGGGRRRRVLSYLAVPDSHRGHGAPREGK